jgi:Ca2+-binding EF-hand superfamily protein
MVNGISTYNNYMSYLQTQTPRSSPNPAEMFNKVDSDGSGGISQSELETFVEGISSKTGNSIDTTDAISTYDVDGNGELSSDELKSFMQATIGPPRGMMGMQGGHAPEDLFKALDTDSSSGISQSELEAFAEDMSSKTGNSIDTTDAVSTYDADGNAELSSDELMSFMRANMPPPGGMGGSQGPMGMSGNEEDTSSSSYLDPLDTNGDGTVDAQEAAAGRRNMLTQNYMSLIESMFGIQEDNQSLVNLAA